MIKTTTMKINFIPLPKWQQRIISESVRYAEDFIFELYNVDCFDLITLKPSNTCRFSKYIPRIGIIRLDINDIGIRLYEFNSIGNYKIIFPNLGYKISYAAQLIHEITHFVQDLEGRIFSEVETTINEIKFLETIGYTVFN